MNLRKITKQELDSTLINLDKILRDVDEPLNLTEETAKELAEKCGQANYAFFSAFENGGEIGTIATLDDEIMVIAVKPYAQGRGVGKSLLEFALSEYPPGTKVRVSASEDAVPFYSRMGFSPDPSDPSNSAEPSGDGKRRGLNMYKIIK